MDQITLQERISIIKSKRESLVKLLEEPNIGTLRIDVNQALEELDELIQEIELTFPSQA